MSKWIEKNINLFIFDILVVSNLYLESTVITNPYY